MQATAYSASRNRGLSDMNAVNAVNAVNAGDRLFGLAE